MILYHGTSSVFLEGILKRGLLPRKKTGNSNYEGPIMSRENFVYLTSDYPMLYATIAVDKHGGDPVIIQLDCSENRLYPDEDFIGTILAHGKTFEEETKIIESVNVKQYKPNWKKSLEYMGTVCTFKIDKNDIIKTFTFEKDTIGLQLALGLDSNPQALARSGIPLAALSFGRNYAELLKVLFDHGPEEVLKRQRECNEQLLSSFKNMP
jgi:hypothetical protein